MVKHVVAGAGVALGIVISVVALRAPTATPVTEPPATLRVPPALAATDVQPMWDPRDVGDLPTVEVPGLPASLDPPASAGPPRGWARTAALVEDGRDLWLVDRHGDWARLRAPERPVDTWGGSSGLTVDGSRVLYTGRSGLWVHRLGEEGWQRLAYPPDFTRAPDWGPATTASDAPDATWLADRRGPRTWYVDVDQGTFTRYDEALEVAASAPGGPLVRIQWDRGRRYLSVGDLGEEQVMWDGATLESLTGPATDGASLAAVRGVGGWSGARGRTERNGLIALRLDDLAVRAYLPVPDPHSWYTDAQQLRAHAWLDGDTVLASVLPQDAGGTGGRRYLFTWGVETRELHLVSSLRGDLRLSVAHTSASNPASR